MKTVNGIAAGLLVLTSMMAPALADNKTIKLTSLEWPPYTGAALKSQGASVAVAKEAFKAMGYNLVVEFYPWSRAVKMAKDDANYYGYFPEYYSSDNAKEFIYSEPMGVGPLGFAERSDSPVIWNTLNDLTKYRIGVVQDYVNADEFDQRVAKKQLTVDVTQSDFKNLRKLESKRIDIAVIDRNVLNYLLNTSPELAAAKKTIRFNGRLLEDKKLYICFRKGVEGERQAKIFNEGIKKVNVNAIMAQYLK